MFAALQALGKRGANIAAQRIVAGQCLVGALDDDYIFLAAQGIDHRRLGERPDDVDVNGADFGIALFAQIIAGTLHIFRRATERHKYSVRILCAIFRNEPVTPAGELGKLLVALLKHAEDGLAEIIAACNAAVHMMLLILHRPEQDGIFQIHHLRHAPTRGAKEFALGGSGAIDNLIGRAQIFTQQIRFRRAIRALGMRGEHSVLNVHPGIERQLVALAQDDRLVGGLLGVASHQHRPAGIQRGIKIIVTTVDIESVLGERARADFHHHRGEFAGRVVILLHRVHDTLSGSEVHRALAGDGHCCSSALRGVFAFALDGQLLVAPNIQRALRKSLLINLTALGGGRDGIKHTALGDARFHPLGHQLVAIAGDGEAGILRLVASLCGGGNFLFNGLFWHIKKSLGYSKQSGRSSRSWLPATPLLHFKCLHHLAPIERDALRWPTVAVPKR